MSDIGLFLSENGFDLAVDENDLLPDDGLETAVSISLFTDKRVTDEQLPSMETSKRGWWGDMFPDVNQDKIGSRLWTLEREKRTNEVLRRSEELSKESLTWMIEDGLADAVIIKSEYNGDGHLLIYVEIQKPDGDSARFRVLWEKQELKRVA